MKQLLFGFVFVAIAMPAAAQSVDVGYSPPKSPFRDLEYHQELTFFGGYLSAAKDPVYRSKMLHCIQHDKCYLLLNKFVNGTI